MDFVTVILTVWGQKLKSHQPTRRFGSVFLMKRIFAIKDFYRIVKKIDFVRLVFAQGNDYML